MSVLSEFSEYIRNLFELAKLVPPDTLAVVVVGSVVVGGAIGWCARWLVKRRPVDRSPHHAEPLPTSPDPGVLATIRDLQSEHGALRQRIRDLEAEIKANQGVLDLMQENEGEIWRLFPSQPPPSYVPPFNASRPKIVMVANNKGGVGKTTLTTYLTAYFLSRRKRVLVIDIDYQGSLTGWLLGAGGIKVPGSQPHRLALANTILSGEPLSQWPAEVLSGQLTGTQLITADYTLTQYETKLMLRWLRQQGDPDIRFNLAQVLMSDDVQNSFDLVLIDAPPRLTTGAINALAACTHLLVPTKLDALSAETVGSFLRQVATLRRQLSLGFELAGVVGTMTPAQPLERQLGRAEQDALAIVRRGLAQWPRDRYIFKRDIQDRADIKHVAGRQLAYAGLAADMFRQFGDELSARIGYEARVSAEAAE